MFGTMNEQVTLGRRSFFSAGLSLHNPAWSDERNRAVFGKAAAPHGHDYVLDAYYRGMVATEDGMIVNITDIKPLLAEVLGGLEGRFLNEEVDYFRARRPTAENVVDFLWQELPAQIASGRLVRLRLEESPRLRVQRTEHAMQVTRNYEFAAAHRLHAPALSEEENDRRYGKCNNPRGHGHNYGLEVTVEGAPDGETGWIIPPAELDAIVDEEVYNRFDHKHLNEDCPEFAGLIPTSENLARVIFDLLRPRLDGAGRRLAKIGLHETQKNYFEVEA